MCMTLVLILEKTLMLTHLIPGQNCSDFADDMFRFIFVNEKFYILIKTSLKFVPNGQIDNKSALL